MDTSFDHSAPPEGAASWITPSPDLQAHTYGDLKAFGMPQLQAAHKSDRDIKNFVSALNGPMNRIGANDASQIDAGQFKKACAEYLAGIERDATVNPATGRRSTYDTRKSQLARWDQLYGELLKTDGLPAPFGEALHELMKRQGMTAWHLAKASGVHESTIRSWLDGCEPSYLSTIVSIGKIEMALRAPASTLLGRTQLMHLAVRRATVHVKPAYNVRLSELVKLEYALPEDQWPALFHRGWNGAVGFKTALVPPPGMQRNKAWREASAAMQTEEMKRFVGFCLGNPDHPDKRLAGLGMRPETLTLAVFTNTATVDAYLAFHTLRSGGIISSFQAVFTQQMKAHLHPVTGYLPQRPELGREIGVNDPAEWRAICQAAFDHYKELLKAYTKQQRQSRPPNAPIQKILDLEHPLEALGELETAIERDKPGKSRPNASKAIWSRNLVLIKILGAGPLRISHFEKMTYHPNNTGHLRRRADGIWVLRFEPHEFKNEDGAAKDSPYVRELPADLTPYIDDYIFNWRKYLIGGDDPSCLYVFRPGPSRNNVKKDCKPTDSWPSSYISEVVRQLTEKYLSHLGVFYAHAIRHIVATEYIKNQEEGYEIAAFLLHDTVDTVRKAYAWIKDADKNKVWLTYRAGVRADHRNAFRNPQSASKELMDLLDLLPDGEQKTKALMLLHRLLDGEA